MHPWLVRDLDRLPNEVYLHVAADFGNEDVDTSASGQCLYIRHPLYNQTGICVQWHLESS